MFSGQGSQYFQMGRELYENHARFKMWMDYCDEIVEPLLDCSLIDVIYDDAYTKATPFDDIRFTNPAIVAIEYSLSRILNEMGLKPDYLLGYSLGEYTASVISGALSIEEALEFVVEYAHILATKTPISGMMAVIDSPSIVTQNPAWFDKVWVSGINFDKHFVVSGLAADVDELEAKLKAEGVMCQQLAVKYGFHTGLIDVAEQDFADIAAGLGGFEPQIPTYSGLKASLVDKVDADYLWQVTRQRVDFHKVVKVILAEVKAQYGHGATFIDVGPSGTLSTFVRYILTPDDDSEYIEVMNQFGNDTQTLEKLRQKL